MTLTVEIRRQPAAELVALATLGVVLWYAEAGLGLAIAVVAVIGWLAGRTIHAFGIGQLLFVVLLTDGMALEEFLIGQLALVGLLAATLLGQWSPRDTVLAVLTFLVSAAALSSVWFLDSILLGLVALAGLYSVAAYRLHLYELTRLEIVTGTES